MKVKIKKLRDDAIMPTYGSEGAGCFDLYALEKQAFNDTAKFDTGVAFEIPEGFVMLVFSRSGHGFKSDVRLSNCVGVIDHDYRNSVQVKLRADGDMFAVEIGDRIAQAVIVPAGNDQFSARIHRCREQGHRWPADDQEGKAARSGNDGLP